MHNRQSRDRTSTGHHRVQTMRHEARDQARFSPFRPAHSPLYRRIGDNDVKLWTCGRQNRQISSCRNVTSALRQAAFSSPLSRPEARHRWLSPRKIEPAGQCYCYTAAPGADVKHTQILSTPMVIGNHIYKFGSLGPRNQHVGFTLSSIPCQ